MAESTVDDLSASKPDRLSWLERLRGNPVMVKELRGRMRGRRAHIVLTGYVLLLCLLVGAVYVTYISNSQNTRSVNDQQGFGKAIFGLVVWMELLTVSFVTPALTAGSVSAEREHQTYDLVRTTLLPARSLVFGKFASAMLYIFLLLLAALPLQSVAFLFGGIGLAEFWIAILILVVTAINFGSAGVFFSSLLKRTLISTVLTYGYVFLVVFGLPLLILLGLAALPVLSQSAGGVPQPGAEAFLVFTGWLVSTLTPLATAVITELILISSQSPFSINFPLSGGSQIHLISPWLPFVVLYLLSSVLLLAFSTRLVKRKDL